MHVKQLEQILIPSKCSVSLKYYWYYLMYVHNHNTTWNILVEFRHVIMWYIFQINSVGFNCSWVCWFMTNSIQRWQVVIEDTWCLDSMVTGTKFIFQPWHLLAKWAWAPYLISLCLIFLVCKMEVIRRSISSGFCEEKPD